MGSGRIGYITGRLECEEHAYLRFLKTHTFIYIILFNININCRAQLLPFQLTLRNGKISYNYSMKNKPTPSKNAYMKNLIFKLKSFIAGIRPISYIFEKSK